MTKFSLVTGASSGIGREMTLLLAKQGKNVVIVARDEKNLKSLAAEIENKYQISVIFIAMDLSSDRAAEKLFQKLNSEDIFIDTLINNAGFGTAGNFWEIATEKEIAELQLNVITLTMLTKLFLPQMIAQKNGKILNVASIAAFFPGPFMTVYFASKAYVLSFSYALREELSGTGVTVTVLCPSSTETNFAKTAGSQTSKAFSGNLLNAKVIAEKGISGMNSGKATVFSNTSSQLITFFAKFVPVTFITRAIKGSLRP